MDRRTSRLIMTITLVGILVVIAVVTFTFGAQPAIVPSSVEKMKRAGPLTVPLAVVMLTTKSLPPANTMRA